MPSSLDQWFHALRACKRGEKNARIIVVGDSLASGFGSTGATPGISGNAVSGSFPTVMAANFAVVPARADSWLGDANAFEDAVTLPSYDSRVTWGSSWGQTNPVDGYFVPGGNAIISLNGTTDLVFNPNVTFDRIRVYFVPYVGAPQCTVSLNGGSSIGTLPQDGTPTGFSVQEYTVSRGNNDVHINPPGADSIIAGVEVFDSLTPRVQVVNAAWAGSATLDWTTNSPDGFAPIEFLPLMAADLVIIVLNGNDLFDGVSEANFKARYAAIIDAATATGAGVLCIGMHFVSSVATGFSEGQQATYNGYCADVCTEKRIKFLNMQARPGWTSFATADGNGYISADDVHPSATGHADWALAVRELIDFLPPNPDGAVAGRRRSAKTTGLSIAADVRDWW